MSKKPGPLPADDDNPDWTEADFKRARPGFEIFKELGIEAPRPQGRFRTAKPQK